MKNFICTTCGVQYEPSPAPPTECRICNEERQYVNPKGQAWTTLEDLQKSGQYKNDVRYEEKRLHSLTTTPGFGIGQTAYLVQEPGFNLLWDCITYLDQETIDNIKQIGEFRRLHYPIRIIIPHRQNGPKPLMRRSIFMKMIENGCKDRADGSFIGRGNQSRYPPG